MTDRLPAFQRKQEPQDQWTAEQLAKYGLPTDASLEEIERTATELLSDIGTSLAGAELVLGRRVDGDIKEEPYVLPIIATPGLDGKTKFGLLLMQRGIEKAQKEE